MDSDSDSDNDTIQSPLPPEIKEVEGTSRISQRVKRNYELAYKQFLRWKLKEKIDSFSEEVLLDYFVFISGKYQSSTLLWHYSMLKYTLSLYYNIKLKNYSKLHLFIKQKRKNHQLKYKMLTPVEINEFITKAPNKKYLATKVVLIIGVLGACRRLELNDLRIEHLRDLKTEYFVTVRSRTKPGLNRTFVISGNYYNICKKYVNIRPFHVPSGSFFLNYQDGKCTFQKMGVNKFGAMAKDVAKFLKLPNPNLYTGQCFRKSTESFLKFQNEKQTNGSLNVYIKNSWKCKMETQTENYEKKLQDVQTNRLVKVESEDGDEGDIDISREKIIFEFCDPSLCRSPSSETSTVRNERTS